MKRSALVPVAGLLFAGGLVAAASFTATALVATPRPASAQTDPCAGLARPGLFSQTTVSSARRVDANAAKGTPSFCEVTAVVSPAKGSSIGVVFRLPDGWNGKMLGLGGGGWAGNVRIEAAEPGLAKGYATMQTDGGHASESVWDTSWVANPQSISDFAYRAIHEMTAVGKLVVAKYYGKPQSRAYYQGCSTGGRQGLMEVQRYPDDYDGVIAGAPVYNLLVQTSAVVRNQTFAAEGAGFTEDQFKLVNQTVLKACDAADGLADGVISDPRQCKWDPAELQCKPGQTGPDCLGKGQVEALRTVYGGVQEIDGRQAAWPLIRGGELGWSRFIQVSATTRDASNGGGLGGALRGPLLGDPNFDMAKFDHTRDVATIRSSAFAKAYEAGNPAIGDFLGKGHKLLLWHGWSDPGPSPVGTIAYHEQVRGSVPASAANERLFLAPGVYHCGGGPGPDKFDLLGALDHWVQTGEAPATLLATKVGSKVSRPLCPYPSVAHYRGAGDPDAAASFECR